MQSSNMLKIGTILANGKYRIDRYLASGGFGNTYLATNLSFDEKVAIKELFIKGICGRSVDASQISISLPVNKDTFIAQQEKFKKEARRLRKMENPHIVRVHDLFDENGTSYYVMDLVDGESLSARLKRTKRPLSESEILKILPQILDALDCIHKEGIWHLDLKPANIMIDSNNGVKLIDFGASKQMRNRNGESISTSSAIAYTPGYASFEQMEQNFEKFGPWTDLYSLGATLYNLLTMQQPPSPSDLEENANAALKFPTVVSEKIENLILWLMKPNRKMRPQSILEVKQYIKKTDSIEETFIPNKIEKQIKNKAGSRKYLIPTITVCICALIGYMVLTKPKNTSVPVTNFIIADSTCRQEVVQQANTEFVIPEDFVLVPGGLLQYKGNYYDDYKHHEAKLDSFYVCKYELTQGDYKKTIGEIKEYNCTWLKSWDDSAKYCHVEGDRIPVRGSYIDFIKYCNKRSLDEGFTGFYEITGDKITVKNDGNGYRLITPYEWIYAAYGGNLEKQDKYLGGDNLSEVAWHLGNSGKVPHPVGEKKPNSIGLYDIQGNAPEYLQGDESHRYYSSMDGSYRVSNWNYPQTYDPKSIWGTNDESYMEQCGFGVRIILITPSMKNRNLVVCKV